MNTSVWKSISSKSKENQVAGGLVILGLIAWLMLFMLGLVGYSGSKGAYAFFSMASGAMLLTGFRQTNSYGYRFLTVFLWLGFWLKLTIHTVLSYPFVEPVGSFLGGAAAWDEVLNTASVASLGVMLGKLLFNRIASRVTLGHSVKEPVVPQWYVQNRKCLWVGMIVACAAALFINMKYGVHQVGLPPRTILMWPLNAVVAWMLNIGMATGIAVFVWWDVGLKKNGMFPIFSIIAEAFLSSVSVLSRAVYVFHTIPQFWALNRFKKKLTGWSPTKTALVATLFTLFLVVSISAVTTFRNYLYQSDVYSSTAYQVAYAEWEVLIVHIEQAEIALKNAPIADRAELLKKLNEMKARLKELKHIQIREKEKWQEALNSGSTETMVLLNEFGYQMSSGFVTRILQLSVDRWIGLEGLMAVQSYPGKRMSVLWHALSGKQEAGETDVYQSVSKSIYLKSDSARYRFRTLPGAAAFLYYSNSLWIVMLGMSFFSVAVLVVELLIKALTANPIICSLYGALVASNVAQFGGSPRESGPYIFILTCGILLIWMVRSNSFALGLQKLKTIRTAQSNGT